MKKIYLSIEEIDLGYLIETDLGFEFVANKDGVLKAEKENSIVMIMFKLNKTGTNTYSQIPEPFSKFLISNTRKDLIEKANISEQDSQFEKLYKLAGLDMMQINFKIHQ
ncbi:MAG: hypothetical protein IJ415_02490 [Clostridia bacterium]|nr:hypothetical protein [Clostridia bacterium]